jgi:hypothetical protein
MHRGVRYPLKHAELREHVNQLSLAHDGGIHKPQEIVEVKEFCAAREVSRGKAGWRRTEFCALQAASGGASPFRSNGTGTTSCDLCEGSQAHE